MKEAFSSSPPFMYGGTRGRDRMRHSVDEANSGFSTHQSKRRRRRGGGKEGE